MDILVLKTHEISQDCWGKIILEFNRAFKLNKRVEELVSFYKRNLFGYSYHAIAFDDQILVGYNAVYPNKYLDREGKGILVGVSGGTFVIPEYRKEIFIFHDMVQALWEKISKEEFVTTIGVSNKNSFLYSKQFLESKLISYLPYYALPVRIFNILKLGKISILNFITVHLAFMHLFINELLYLLLKSQEKQAKFELDTNDDFYSNRFGGNNYKEITLIETKAYYRVMEEGGIRVAYLFDFRENKKRSYKALLVSVKYLLKKEKPDMILFIGHLRLRQFLLVRIPWKFEPQHLPLTFNITSSKYTEYSESMSIAANWNFGLMNFDAR